MKVYVVTHTDYDGISESVAVEIVGVFTGEEQAKQAAKDRAAQEEYPDLADHDIDINEAELDEYDRAAAPVKGG